MATAPAPEFVAMMDERRPGNTPTGERRKGGGAAVVHLGPPEGDEGKAIVKHLLVKKMSYFKS